MADAEKRMLKIKTGSVVRLKKELGLYETEKESEVQRVARMKEQGADKYDIKHAVSPAQHIHMCLAAAHRHLYGFYLVRLLEAVKVSTLRRRAFWKKPKS